VKDSKHTLRALMLDDGTEIGIKDIRYAAKLLNEISEEVHRAAIGYHKSVRSKTMLRIGLEDIEGIGKKRSVALLKHFGSVNKIKNATVEQLCEVQGMSKAGAQKVYEHFNNENN